MDKMLNSDPLNLVEKIVVEVKQKGLFDKFRKDCISDVDTKPAYQNLKTRVENSVASFLKEQNWTPELNRNHIREKLRKHITESAFLDTGVERIVDQVVNPKISTVFLPQVEEVICKYLGIDKLPYKTAPDFKFKTNSTTNGELKVETELLPDLDLEAVSPDSDRSKSLHNSNEHLNQIGDTNELFNESSDKLDDFESPAFEPIERANNKEESNDSHLSGISEFDSISSEKDEINDKTINEESSSALLIETINQDSQLSQVSSNSRLSIITHSNESTSPKLDMFETARMAKSDDESGGGGRINGLPTSFEMIKIEINKDFTKITENTEIKTNKFESEMELKNEIKEEKMDVDKDIVKQDLNEVTTDNTNSNDDRKTITEEFKNSYPEQTLINDLKEKKNDNNTIQMKKEDSNSDENKNDFNPTSVVPQEESQLTIVKTEELCPKNDDVNDESNNKLNLLCPEEVNIKKESSPSSVDVIKIIEESNISDDSIIVNVKKNDSLNIKIEEISNSESNNGGSSGSTPKDSENSRSTTKEGSNDSVSDKKSTNDKSREKDYRSHDRSKYKQSKSNESSSDKSREKNRTLSSSSKNYSSSNSRDTDRYDEKRSRDKNRKDEYKEKTAFDDKDKDKERERERSRDYYKTSKSSSSSSKHTSSSSSSYKDKDKKNKDKDKRDTYSSSSSHRDKDDKNSKSRSYSRSESTKSNSSKSRTDKDKESTKTSGRDRDKTKKSNSSKSLMTTDSDKRKDKKQDDHSSSRDKLHDKRRSTDREDDGSNSGHGNAFSSNRIDTNSTSTISSTTTTKTNSSEQSSSTSTSSTSPVSSTSSSRNNTKTVVVDSAVILNNTEDFNINLKEHKSESEKVDSLKSIPIVILDSTINLDNMEVIMRPINDNGGRDSGIELSEFGTDDNNILLLPKKKPKFASNIFEAKKLMKIRKKMERDLLLRRNNNDNEKLYYFPEKYSKYRINTDCLVFAKAYIDECEKLIDTNLPYDSTGYMLNCSPEYINLAKETFNFVCQIDDNNQRTHLDGKLTLPPSMKTNSMLPSTTTTKLSSSTTEIQINYSNEYQQQKSDNNKQCLFEENNKFNYDDYNFIQNDLNIIDIEEDCYLQTTADEIKRKSDDGFNNNINSSTKKIKLNNIDQTLDNVVLPENLSTSMETETNVTSTATIRKIRSKLNLKASQCYSSDDLYKPRNIFGRSRRRGLDSNDVTL